MISILMATYNGERYIKEQIDSILAQTVQDFVLYINDDCSTDATPAILAEYAARCPGKVIVTANANNSGSSKQNFLHLMARPAAPAPAADYFMLADQDDFWLPDKIEKTLAKMRELEAAHGADTPLLAYTDLKVAAEDLTIIADSMMHRVNADFADISLKGELVQNTLTGCTAMYNRALAALITESTLPAYTVMHDWWLMLLAVTFGHAGYLAEPTILYRQHGDNSVGTRNMRSAGFAAKFFFKGAVIRKALAETYEQAAALEEFVQRELAGAGDKADRSGPSEAEPSGAANADAAHFAPASADAAACAIQEKLALIRSYASLRKKGKLARVATILKLGTLKQGLSRRIAQLIYC